MAKTTILVVDDARLVRRFVRQALAKLPEVTIEEAEDGSEAQAILSELHCDLVLCDWDMPKVSGHELLRWLRTHEQARLRETPFIMVTGSGEKEKVVQAVTSGVSGYVVKPFTPTQILHQVQEVLSRHPSITATRTEQPPGGTGLPAQLKHRDGTLEVEVTSVTRRGLVARVTSGVALPALLAPVVAQLQAPGSGEVASCTGYVWRLETAEDSPNPEYLQVGVRFLDLDADKTGFLVKHFAASGR